jgi:serine phosphatase RsbU (regulator of sigma subunit)
MLGVVAQPTFQTCEVSLSAGDAIVLCSDGLQDAEIDGERIDERRVADLLAGPPAASARMLVRRLTDALGETARPLRDDVAIMVLQMTHPQPA